MTHSSLEAVVEIFSSNLGIHRINVVNNQGRVEGLLSKTDVVRFLLSKVGAEGIWGRIMMVLIRMPIAHATSRRCWARPSTKP